MEELKFQKKNTIKLKKEIKDETIRLRLTKGEKKIIKELAKEKGLTITDLVKCAINKVIEEV